MNKQQARNIICETFENPFDKNRFAGFIKNILNHIDEAPLTYQGNYIPDAYKQSIKTLKRVGKFKDGENSIDLLVEQIFAAKQKDMNVNTSTIESEIDHMVFKLYGLTEEEIKIVEGEGK